jgi:hypothetical protein
MLDLHFTPVLAELICAAVDLDAPALDLAASERVSSTVQLRPRRRGIGASTLTVVAGHAIDGTGDSDDAMVSTTMAMRHHLKVGSTFSA